MRYYSPRLFALCAFLVAFSIALTPGITLGANLVRASAHSSGMHPASLVSRLTDEILQLLNQDRVKDGRRRLLLDHRLTLLATSHSDDMAARHYFGHTAPGETDPFLRFRRLGIHYADAAENIGFASSRPLAEELRLINAAMMAEPLTGVTHHTIIVDPRLGRVGIGICIRPRNTIYLTEDFTN